ncbi:MAG: DUF6458 family protein [Actinomycetota bacterium]|nr:DUF6458 family protein [Actinomycetota bacterium]
MGIGVSVFLIAVGAVLAFAVNVTASGIDVQTVGVILMAVGIIGLLTSLVIFSGHGTWGRRRTVVSDDYAPVGSGRRVVREDYVD